MPGWSELLQRNQAFAETYRPEGLSVLPAHGVVVLTCVDPRVDPAHFLGLQLGDAKVLRNAGARVTDAVIRDLAFVAALLKQVNGTAVPLELAIVQHTQCGAGRLAEPDFRRDIAGASGIVPEVLAAAGIDNHSVALKADIARLRASTLRLDGIRVSGHLYDVETGLIRELIPASSIR